MADTNIGQHFGEPLFEIAVYRVTPERWLEDLEQLDAEARGMVETTTGGLLPPERFDRRVMEMQELRRREIGHFPYGQVVGWLRLLHDGPGPLIKGYGYLLPQQVIFRRFRQTHFRDTGKEVEIGFEYSGASNTEIVAELRAAIMSTTAEGRVFRRRWLDMAAFDKVAPRVDWRGLLDLPG